VGADLLGVIAHQIRQGEVKPNAIVCKTGKTRGCDGRATLGREEIQPGNSSQTTP